MTEMCDDYQDWDEEVKDSPLALVGKLVMALTVLLILANALFMQPKSAQMKLIDQADKTTTGQIGQTQRAETAASEANSILQSDRAALVLAVQRRLRMIGYYGGALDGKESTALRDSILAYQDAYGLPATGTTTTELLTLLEGGTTNATPHRAMAQTQSTNESGLNNNDLVEAQTTRSSPSTQSSKPATLPVITLTQLPRSKALRRQATPQAHQQMANASQRHAEKKEGDPILAKIQAALTQYGFGQLETDGLMGNKTRAAIAQFQRKRGLPVTGKIDDRLLQDMLVLGYIDLG